MYHQDPDKGYCMRCKSILMIVLYIVVFPILASAGEGLAAGKPVILPYGRLMHVAYQEGEKIGYPDTIQGILLRETNGGRYRGSSQAARSNQCYGVMQIRLDTAKFVLENIWRVPKSDRLSDSQLRQKIRNDDAFNVKIATSYFKYLLSLNPGPEQWEKAVLSYNTGSSRLPGNGNAFAQNGYVRSVRRLIDTDVRRFNAVHTIN